VREIFELGDFFAVLLAGGVAVALFDYAMHRTVRTRVLFTITPRTRGRTLDYALKARRCPR
jgi:hypothetical protein